VRTKSDDEGGEKAGARNLVFFRVEWLQPAMKGTSCVRSVCLGGVECEECSEKCEVRSGASNVTCETGHNFRKVHARTGLAGARRMQVL
jgi:hypothetical protein